MRDILKMMVFALSDLIVASGREASAADHGRMLTFGLLVSAHMADLGAAVMFLSPDLMALAASHRTFVVCASAAVSIPYYLHVRGLLTEARTEFGDNEEIMIGFRRRWRMLVLVYLVVSWAAFAAGIVYSAARRSSGA